MSAFGTTLAAIRRSRPRLSQSRLAEAAGYDHSYVSRCETGTREPSRAAVLALADALGATDVERDTLLEAGGFKALVTIPRNDLTVAELHDLLSDASVPVAARDAVRQIVGGALAMARRVAA